MDTKQLRAVIHCTANLTPKEISLTKLAFCLKNMDDSVCWSDEAVPDVLWKITCQYYAILIRFADKYVQQLSTECTELESIHDHNCFVATVDIVRQFTLHLYLPQELRNVTKSEAKLHVMVEEKERARRLSYCVDQFRLLFHKKVLLLHPRIADSAIDFISGLYSLSANSIITHMQTIAFPNELLLQCLLMIKGTKQLSVDLSKVIHNDLLQLVGESGGFSKLCRTLLKDHGSDADSSAWHNSEVIAKIITSKGHSKKFYRQVLTDCFATYREAIFSKPSNTISYVNTCVECLRRFYQLPLAYKELHERIEAYFLGRFQILIYPEELITGCVVVEKTKLLNDLYECQVAFSGSPITSLPSSLLTSHLALFLHLYSILPPSSSERKYLQDMIIFCLANRTKQELKAIVLSFALEYSRHGIDIVPFTLHPRIVLKPSSISDSYTLQIGPVANDTNLLDNNLLVILGEMLISANRNLLIYDVFIVILSELMTPVASSNDNILHDETEQTYMLCKRFYRKIILIQPLTDLISHNPFHQQMYDNSDEILQVLESSLEHLIVVDIDKNNDSSESEHEDVMDVVLSILREFLRRMHNLDKVQKVFGLLRRLKSQIGCSDRLKEKIEYICNTCTADNEELSDSTCQTALSLCTDLEPYCKVYGTTLLLKLLKDRDIETIAQRHTILILALENLHNEESYAFLNSVRLLVALSEVLESEVVLVLLKEYQNVDNSLDYRLKIGEATVKTIEAMGPMAIRYRDELLNCFLAGTKNDAEEFRTSSLSIIGNICRILCYQVHNFFYELFYTVCSIVETDKYIPARRASILVLSQIIEGIEHLMDLQEHLPPVYRYLKHIIASEKDDITKIQAAIALDHLNIKTKDFFTSDYLEKQMFGKII